MSEKVKLPKNVCDALDEIQIDIQDKGRIFHDISNGYYSIKYPVFHKEIIHKGLRFELMRALVFGYEPELTQEERIKYIFKTPYAFTHFSKYEAYRQGIRDTLRILGIKYEWLEGDAE